jgi:hypothetical protein
MNPYQRTPQNVLPFISSKYCANCYFSKTLHEAASKDIQRRQFVFIDAGTTNLAAAWGLSSIGGSPGTNTFPTPFEVVMQSGDGSRTHFYSAAAAYEALR